MACKPINSIIIENNPPVNRAPIVMVDRGDCHFTKKVKNVESIGGHIALIVDRPSSDTTPNNIIMSDDGTGKDITIPGVLIGFSDGEILKDYYRKNPDTDIIMEFEFEMVSLLTKEHFNNNLKINIFMKSDDINVYKMFADLSFYHNRIVDLTIFEPHYITSNFAYNALSPKVSANCYSAGKYCTNPNSNLNISNGREIINENLRQKCVWKVAYTKKETRVQYWNYMNLFYSLCIDIENPRFNTDCSYECMEFLGIDQSAVRGCVNKSFEFAGISSSIADTIYLVENTLLKNDRFVYDDFHIMYIPTILINNRTFWVDN